MVSLGQQQGKGLAGGGVGGVANDLAAAVDRGRVLDLRAGSGRDQVVQVLHGAAVDLGSADHHAVVADRRSEEDAQAGQRAVTVEEPLAAAAR